MLARLSFLLFLFLPLGFATDYVTMRSGNWHDNGAGTTPWATGTCASPTQSLSTPGSGDRVKLCNTFTLHCETGQTCTIGDSPANDTSTAAIQNDTGSGTGILALDSGSAFVFKGSIRQSNATWTAGAGVSITHDSSTATGTPAYTWRVGQASLTNAVVQLNGTVGARTTLTAAVGSGHFGGFTQSFTNGGQVIATYTDFSFCGTYDSTACNTTSLDATIGIPFSYYDHCTTDTNSGGIVITNIVGNAIVTFTSNKFSGRGSSSRALSVGTGTVATLTTGIRSITGNHFINGVFYIGAPATVTGNTGRMSSSTLTNIATRNPGSEPAFNAGDWHDNIWWLDTGIFNNQASHLPGGTLQRDYWLESSSVTCGATQNYHFTYAAAINSIYDGLIFDSDCGGGQQNAYQYTPTSAVVTTEVKNNIILPGTVTTFGVGTGLFDIPSSCNGTTLKCPLVSVHHNTVALGDSPGSEAGLGGFEGGTPPAPAYSRGGDNILWLPSPGNSSFTGWTGATVLAGALVGFDYNWQYNITGGQKYKNSGTSVYASPAPPGAHDQTGNPQFADATRNFLKWCKSINPADNTWADCFVHLEADTAGYTPGVLIDYVRTGFVPSNALVATASSTGTYVGAVPPDGSAAPPSAPPVVKYTDLDSGPNTGGEHGNGVYVTIFGKYFGTVQGTSTVKIGGGLVATYVSWSDTKIVVELGAAAANGAVVVRVNGVDSNLTVTFKVRSGNIYFVSTGGSDTTGDGSFGNPYLTVSKCYTQATAGTTCYIENGVIANVQMSNNTIIFVNKSGTVDNPIAFVGYPGAVATIDASANSAYVSGIRPNAGTGAPYNYWTFANLKVIGGGNGTINGGGSGIQAIGQHWRVINNVLTCPNSTGQSACIEASDSLHSVILGNEVYGAGCNETASPCAYQTPATTISSVGTTVTLSAFTSVFSAGDAILANGQTRHTISCASGTVCTLDAPFSPDLSAGTSWQWREYTANKQFHSIYASTDSSWMEIAYNYIHDNFSCRGIQLHSSPTFSTTAISIASNTSPIVITHTSAVWHSGTRMEITGVATNTNANGNWFINVLTATTAELWADKDQTVPSVPNGTGTGGLAANGLAMHDISVHDNDISGQVCDGINPATVDPSIGPIDIYNNIVHDSGIGGTNGIVDGLDPSGGLSNYTALYNSRLVNNGNAGTGTINVYNNTFVNNGTGGTSAGARGAVGSPVGAGGPALSLVNNIIIQSGTTSYLQPNAVNYGGNNNLWFGIGSAPSGFTASLNVDPLFTNSAIYDYSLQTGSPALGAGSLTGSSVLDFASVYRANPPAMGANDVQGVPPTPPVTPGVSKIFTGTIRFGGGVQ